MKSTANVFQIILPLRRSRRQASNNPLGRLILALAALVVNPSFIPPAQAAGSVNTGLLSTARDAAGTPEAAPAKTAPAIPWDQLGAKAGADYRGDGLTVTPTAGGARLHCVFQRLDGEATREGLWLTSTVTNQPNDRFRVTAAAVGRQVVGNTQRPPRSVGTRSTASLISRQNGDAVERVPTRRLPALGSISVDGQTVRFSRPGLVEEYSVSMDGVRQDFVVTEKPAGAGHLQVRLGVAGAKVEAMVGGARLVLPQSGRKIAYSRLRATDASGRELPARIEVASGISPDAEGAPPAAPGFTVESAGPESLTLRQAGMPAAAMLVVVVNDAEAMYPVRIDPTFCDANWISLGGYLGADGQVNAALEDGSGNLYIGGSFDTVGNTYAAGVAQWNGSSWSPLGSGLTNGVGALAMSGGTLYASSLFIASGNMVAGVAQWNGSSWSPLLWGRSGASGGVGALAVLGTNLYAGGFFTTAGGSAANYIAQWNGSSWSALGQGVNNYVNALAVVGTNLYAAGDFTTAGGSPANCIAQWNGSSWSALGQGVNYEVAALAVSGSTLYAGGWFTSAGGKATYGIAQWNGSSWSALGSGLRSYPNGPYVYALAVSGGTLYAGGMFTMAGDNPANNIAQWNGSSWSALGSGIVGSYPYDYVYALAVSGSTLYVGGSFTNAGGAWANNLARWDGSSWSMPGSGISANSLFQGTVYALAVSGSTLYAGGNFTMAGGRPAINIAQWNGSSWSAMGAEFTYDVYSLAVMGSTLYAGGWGVYQWNGSSWSLLGSGAGSLGPQVLALAVSGSTLYAGGTFGGASGINWIAQWNGNTWSSVGSGLGGEVHALAVSGGKLYAGGTFTQAGGNPANCVAQWDGSSWAAPGGGRRR